MKSLVVIPAFNEEKSIESVLSELKQHSGNLDIIVVNDGSTDQTSKIAKNLGVRVLDLPFNLGVGGAMRTGFLFAQRFNYECLIQVDADGQHSAVEISKLLEEILQFDVVIGSRFIFQQNKYKTEKYRRIAMRWLAFLVYLITRRKYYDVTSGFRAYSAAAIEIFSRSYPRHYLGDTVEALIIADKAGLTVKEIPVAMRQRLHGQPSQSFLKAFWHLIRSTIAILAGAMSKFGVRKN